MRASLPAAQPRSTAGCCRRQCARPFCPPCCCSSAATAALDAWLAAEGLPAQPLRAAAVEPGGRGLVATEALRAGSRPLAVPASLLLTRDAAVAGAPAWLAPALAALPGDLPALALFLAWARAEAEAASGAGAPLPRWGAYALSLPAATGNVWEWPPGEGRRLFAALPARARQAASRQADADEALAAAASLELPAAAAPGWPRLLRWAFAALAARLVRLRGVGLGGGGEVLALVPFGDLANHRDGAGHLEWDALRRCVTLRIAQPVPAGGQVFASCAWRDCVWDRGKHNCTVWDCVATPHNTAQQQHTSA